jgi:hypothetical protein
MKTVQIRRLDGEDRIFIDDQLFDWGIDQEAINEISKINNIEDLIEIHENIRQYFLQSIGFFLERNITIKEAYEAIKNGTI